MSLNLYAIKELNTAEKPRSKFAPSLPRRIWLTHTKIFLSTFSDISWQPIQSHLFFKLKKGNCIHNHSGVTPEVVFIVLIYHNSIETCLKRVKNGGYEKGSAGSSVTVPKLCNSQTLYQEWRHMCQMLKNTRVEWVTGRECFRKHFFFLYAPQLIQVRRRRGLTWPRKFDLTNSTTQRFRFLGKAAKGSYPSSKVGY